MALVLQGLLNCWSEPATEDFAGSWTVDTEVAQAPPGPQADEAGNYQAPALIGMVEVLNRFEQAEIDAQQAWSELQDLRHEVQQRLEWMRLSVEQGWDQAEDELHQWLRSGFCRFDQALEWAQHSLSSEPSVRLQAIELAQQATNDLAAGMQRFLEHAEACSTVHCPRCSKANRRGAEHCSGCASTLPRSPEVVLAQAEVPELERTTPNHDRLVDAIDAVYAGELGPEGFEREWSAIWGHMQGHYRSIQQDRRDVARHSGSAVEAYRNVLEAIEEGVLASLEALEVMRGYLDTGSSSYLSRGLDLLMQATPLLIEAQELLQSLEV